MCVYISLYNMMIMYIYMYTHIISIYLRRHVNGLKEETDTHPISRSSESYLIENRDVMSLGASFVLGQVLPVVIQHTYFSSLVDFSKTWLDIHHKSGRFTTKMAMSRH